MIPFVGFAPDSPPETPGVFLECTNILPALGGFVAAPSAMDAGMGALTGSAKGFAVVSYLDNTVSSFAGDATKLYKSNAGASWLDVSKVGGYTVGTDERWRFAQFGDVTLASCKGATIQYIDSSGAAFADAGTAPKADIIETINNQVFAFNINGMGFGDDVTRWACSALGDYADWTPSVSTQCVSGQLLDSPGPITAGKRLGDVIVAYKQTAMYVGQYVGAPNVWDFRKIPGNIGASCNEAVVSTGTAHFFVGPDDFYIYDGSRPQPLNSPVRGWFLNESNPLYRYKICGTFDRTNQRVLWWFSSKSRNDGVLDKCIVYNVKTNQWGRVDEAIEYVAEYIASGVTYDALGSYFSTYDDISTTVSYDSPFWTAGASVVAYFKTDHKAYQMAGTPGESRLTTGHYGDNLQFSTITRVRPRFIRSPTSSTMKYSHSNTDATNFTQNINCTYTNNYYDLIWSARWHKFEMIFNGTMFISGFDLLMTPDGSE